MPGNTRATTDIDYASYIGVDRLLDSVQPLTPPSEGTTHASEHLFIVAHQTAELWLKQVLVDVDRACGVLGFGPTDIERASIHVGRSAAALRRVVDATAALQDLPPAEFARFRSELGTASGAQSRQFRELACCLGVRTGHSALFDRFLQVVDSNSLSLARLYRLGPAAGPLYRLAEDFTELADAFWRWQVGHLAIVRREIGAADGTGGTDGLDYLADRIELPFPALWTARADLAGGGR